MIKAGSQGKSTFCLRARRLLTEEPEPEGWATGDLAQRMIGLSKLRMARHLRAEATMALDWIARELNMGAAGSLANLLRRKKSRKYVIMRRPLYAAK